jgi:hypothetical protein
MATTKVIPDVLDLNESTSESGLKIPSGTELNRPATDVAGMIRNNTNETSASSASCEEYYNGTAWKKLNNVVTCTASTCSFPTTARALYQFNDNAIDTCGSYNGSASNVSYVTGKINKAAQFNGSSSFINVGNVIGGNVYTYSFWAKPASIASGVYGAMIGSASPDVTYYQEDSKLSIYNGSGSSYLTATNIFLNTTDWVNIVAVATGSQILIYRNGVLSNTFNDTPANSETIIFGKHPRFSVEYYNGLLDQVRIFAVTLTASQVTDLYNETC